MYKPLLTLNVKESGNSEDFYLSEITGCDWSSDVCSSDLFLPFGDKDSENKVWPPHPCLLGTQELPGKIKTRNKN